MALPPMPPSVRGVSEGDLPPSPLAMLARRMSAKPESAAQKIGKALGLLRQAAQEDPRMEDRIGDAIRALVQAEHEDESEKEKSGPETSFQGILRP